MNNPQSHLTTHAELLEQTRSAWTCPPLAELDPSQLVSGDVFVCRHDAEPGVEWAVLAERGPGQLLIVPADGQPLVGTADFEVPAEDDGAPLVLRCRFGGWVSSDGLQDLHRTGRLSGTVLPRALHHRRDVESAFAPGGSGRLDFATEIALEIDDDPEYLSWLHETVEPAWRSLAPRQRLPEPSPDTAHSSSESRSQPTEARKAEPSAAWVGHGDGADSGSFAHLGTEVSGPKDRSKPGRRRFRRQLMALAASTILALGAALFWHQHQELHSWREAAHDHADEVANLRQQQNQWQEMARQAADTVAAIEAAAREAREQKQLAEREAAQRRRALEVEAAQQIRDLSRRLDEARAGNDVVNPRIESLEPPRERRGSMKRIQLDADASHLLLAVALERSGSPSSYTVELRSEDDQLIWSRSHLKRSAFGLWVGVPASLLEPGRYLLHVIDPGSTSEENIAEYPLHIVGESPSANDE